MLELILAGEAHHGATRYGVEARLITAGSFNHVWQMLYVIYNDAVDRINDDLHLVKVIYVVNILLGEGMSPDKNNDPIIEMTFSL